MEGNLFFGAKLSISCIVAYSGHFVEKLVIMTPKNVHFYVMIFPIFILENTSNDRFPPSNRVLSFELLTENTKIMRLIRSRIKHCSV